MIDLSSQASALEDLLVSFEPLPPLKILAQMWQALEKISNPSFFQSWYWVRCWIETSGADPRLLVARSSKGAILGLALLHEAQKRQYGRKVSTLYLQETGVPEIDSIYIEYNGFLAATAHKEAVTRQCFRYLADSAQIDGFKRSWQDIRLSGIDAFTKDLAEASNYSVHLDEERRSYFIDVDTIRLSEKKYLETLSRNTRQRINHARRLYEKYGEIEIRRAADLGEAVEFFDRLKVLHQNYWHSKGNPGAFSSQYFEKFQRKLLETAFENDEIDVLRLTAGEEEIGYLLNFVLDRTVYQYQSGFSYAHPKLIPGYLTHALAVQYYMDREFATYNFLAGENQQKVSMCSGSETLYWLTIRDRRKPYLFEKLTNLEFVKPFLGTDQISPSAQNATRTLKKALVMGDDVRSFLGTVRSLGRQGIIVDACPFDIGSPALRSRYLRKIHHLPTYARDPDAWISAMRRIIQSDNYDLVIPCDDRSIIPLMQHRSKFDNQNIALPNKKAFECFYDKHRTRLLAEASDVPIAPGRLLNENDTAATLEAEFGLPLAVKPRRSYLLDSPDRRQGVVICSSLEELKNCLRDIEQHDAFFLEGFFDGYGVGVSILAHNGHVLQAFEHHRVQEPLSGGGSSYRVSHALSQPMLDCVKRLVANSDYTGVGMFEFRFDSATGAFILLEVNARLWGSLPLPIAAGVDFPYLLYRLLVDDFEEPMQSYKVGLYGRNVTADFYCTVENFSHLKQKNKIAALSYLCRSMLQWLRVLTPNEKHDSFSLDDPCPGFREYRDLFANFGGGIRKRLPIPVFERSKR